MIIEAQTTADAAVGTASASRDSISVRLAAEALLGFVGPRLSGEHLLDVGLPLPLQELRRPMAKQSLIQREEKREKLVAKFAKKYNELKTTANDAKKSDEERYLARLELQKLPRNAFPTRLRNRCELTGRPRGTFRTFGLGRSKIRELAFKGDIPGVTKASW